MEDTIEGWRSWSRMHQRYEGPWADMVGHSGRVLQALTFYPTGAIVAAPTTSLPETVGGVRNWDYRFTWLPDASFTLEALWVAACPDEASKFFEFLAGAALTRMRAGADLQIMIGIAGEHDLTEREIEKIDERLTDRHGLVHRYRCDDGLPGEEGAFLLCTFWLAQARAMSGQIARAKEIFSRAVAFANDVGLLAEEVKPATGELLGNFPQAFSHIGLINAAWAISQAEAKQSAASTPR
jgi:GH15 family glucan-1,4-alpha-glucosidase